MGGMEDVLVYLDVALAIHAELKAIYPEDYLLHGDLHGGNLLRNATGNYTIIDPKGVVDALCLETARHLGNELPCEEEQLMESIAIIAETLHLPAIDILKSLFVDTALSYSWNLEEHYPSEKALAEAKQETLKRCSYVHGLLDEYAKQ